MSLFKNFLLTKKQKKKYFGTFLWSDRYFYGIFSVLLFWKTKLAQQKRGQKAFFYRPIPFPPPSSFRKGGGEEESPNQNPSGGNFPFPPLSRTRTTVSPPFRECRPARNGKLLLSPSSSSSSYSSSSSSSSSSRSLEGGKGEGGSEALENGIYPSLVCSV